MSSAATTPVILAAKRTPIGKFFGGLARVPAPVLGSYAIKAVLDSAPALKAAVDECIMGCVLQAGVGQNPARQAALKAGLPDTLSCVTVNKVCGSGLQAVMQAAQSIRAGDNHLVIAGGCENMTMAPHFARVREGVKYGPAQMEDHMAYDGLRCAFEGWAMGNAADHIARTHEISRAEQDRFSAQSHQRAAEATKQGWFKNEIVALTGEQCLDKKSPGVAADEGIRTDSTADSLAKLRPAFDKDGSVTAGNASQISDGAAALAVASLAKAEALGIKPIARILASHTSGVAPKDIFAAPINGIAGVLDKAGLKTTDIDLFEINEAFAAQVLCNIKALKIDEKRLNIVGGGVALGHPIGASGARVLTTLIHQLHRTGGKRGIAALCLGGGNAVAMVVEI
ncbi:MAG: thiolase family protein [Planctomycetaceae bacterium]|jgi:acetyl-CoA C-acetyltransferase|nr:thiolase family protein [Phycisphaerales bacterium]MCE2651933.1 thiolase family protein [Planctomycetaceae bacterium]